MSTATKAKRKTKSIEKLNPLELRTHRPSELAHVATVLIRPAVENHRKDFDPDKLEELAASIRANGILQPLLLRRVIPEHDACIYEIVAGERRWRAAKMAGLEEVPAQIVETSGVNSAVAMLHENIVRQDLNPIERAEAIRRMMEEFSLTQAEVGEIIGVQQGQISNELRLLKLPKSLQDQVAHGRIAPTLIRTILPVAEIPVVVNAIADAIAKLNDEVPVDVEFLQSQMREAVLKHTRDMRVNQVLDWVAPKTTSRHFSKVTPEHERLLDVREFKFLQTWDGQRRAVNVELFDQLNKMPYQNRLKKHKEYKAGKKSSAPKKSSKVMFESEWQVRHQLETDCCELLADALESCKDKAAARTVSLVLLAMSERVSVADVDWRVFDQDKVAGQLLQVLNVSPAQQDQIIRTALVAELRENFSMPVSETLILGKALGVDLLQLWKPSSGLLGTLTQEGRLAMAEIGGVDPDRLCVVDPVSGTTEVSWPAGLIPEFLNPFFEIEVAS